MPETRTPSRRKPDDSSDDNQNINDEYVSANRSIAILSALFLVSLLSQVDRMLPFIMAEAIKTDLMLSDTEIGLITGLAFAVCYTLLSLPLARAVDRGSPRRVLVGCILLWSAMTALGGLAMGFAALAVTRFGVAFGEAGAMPAGHAIIARAVPPERRGRAIALFALGVPIGTMVGFAGGGAMADTLGWRAALFGAGAVGAVIAGLTFAILPPLPPLRRPAATAPRSFLRASLTLLAAPAFRWLAVAALANSFAAGPFYVFAAPFLIRQHELSASTAGLAFGLLQGLMGLAGALLGGRWFDGVIGAGTGRVLGLPGILFLLASVTTTVALFVPVTGLAVLALVPAMLAFAFMLPCGFGAAHHIAGRGQEAMATSLLMLASGLLGPALGPLCVGLVSDAATAAGHDNSLGVGLLIVPVASLATGVALLTANRRVAAVLAPPPAPT